MGIVRRNGSLHPFAVRLIRKKARSIAGRSGMNNEDVEDLEQAITLVLLQKLHRYDPSRGNEQQFIATIVRSALASNIERQCAWKRGANIEHVSLDAPVCRDDLDCKTGHDTFDRSTYLRMTRDSDTPDARACDIHIDYRRIRDSLPADLASLARQLETMSISEIARESGIPRTTLTDKVGCVRQRLLDGGLADYFENLPSHRRRFR